MLKSLLKALGIGAAGGISIVVGNHYFVHSSWQSQHPLVLESLALIKKDHKIIRNLGNAIERNGGVSGVLEPHKRWANITYSVKGLTDAKISVVADAKEINDPEITEEFLPLGKYDRPFSSLDWIIELFYGSPSENIELKWKIVAMTVKFDEIYSYNIIGDGIRTHKELKNNEKMIGSDDEEEVQSVSTQRRKNVLQKISKTYWKMLVAGVFVLGGGIYVLRFFKHTPVKNSLFLNKALELMKTEEFVRKELGIPLQISESVKGYLNYDRSQGNALGYIYGPLGWARVKIVGSLNKKTKVWNYSRIAVTKDGISHEFRFKDY